MSSNAILLLLIPASFITSTISAMFGMAGGVSLIAVLTLLLPPEVVVPIHAIAQLFSNSARSVLFLRKVRWRYVLVYVGPLLIGTVVAAQLWSGSKLEWMKPVIGVFILCVLALRRWSPRFENLPLAIYAPLGLVVGFIGIFVGATGPLLAPFFLRTDFAKEEVIATKAICQTVGHVLKIPAFLSLGFDYGAHLDVLGVLVISGFFGTLLGKRLLERMPERVFVLVFEGILIVTALYFIGSSFPLS